MLLTDEEIARVVDVSRSTVERWRSGQTAPLAGVMPLIIDGVAKAKLKQVVEYIETELIHGGRLGEPEQDGKDVYFLDAKGWQALRDEVKDET